MLHPSEFKTAVRTMPLIAIDLIIRNHSGQILVGRRKNAPAKSYWFVPGGRIHKNENLDFAFARITNDELGMAFLREQGNLYGLYDHFYSEDFTGSTDCGTHYVVLAHEIDVSDIDLTLPTAQHSAYRWMSATELLSDPAVHDNTKAYVETSRTGNRKHALAQQRSQKAFESGSS